MSILRLTQFGGIVPRLTKRGLPDNAAQDAVNLMADTMEFRPLPADAAQQEVALIGTGETIKTLYRYPTAADTMIGSPLALSMVKSPIIDDQYDRVYASAMYGEADSSAGGDHRPSVMSNGVAFPSVSLRPLGVKFPTGKPTLSYASGSDVLVTPADVKDSLDDLMSQVKTIVRSALVIQPWNPLFESSPLTANRGFRSADGTGASGLWQRVWAVQASGPGTPIIPGTWNTLNGTALERHLWIAEVQNPASKDYTTLPFMDGSLTANRAYFAEFPAQVTVYTINQDVTAQTTALQNLLIPHTTDRLFSDEEVTGLWAALRAWLPSNPMNTPSAEAVSLFETFKSQYSELVNDLEYGFETSTTPAMALQAVTSGIEALFATQRSIAAAYEAFAGPEFDAALISYLDTTRFDGKLGEGDIPIIDPRFYTYTFVNTWGEESKPYLPGDGNSDTEFEIIEVNQKQSVQVDRGSIAHLTELDSITHWRLYRAATAQTTTMQLVAEIPIATSTFVDSRKTESLGEGLLTTEFWPPPVHGTPGAALESRKNLGTASGSFRFLKNLVAMPGGFLAGCIDNTVYFSAVNHPYAWPPVYAMPVENTVTGLGVFGNTLVVLTDGKPCYISGDAPDNMGKVDIESGESCASARSVVPVSGGVLFASWNGLCVASQQGIKNMTAELMTHMEWQSSVDPRDLICEELDGTVYIAKPNITYAAAFHVPTGKLTRIDSRLTAMFADYRNGRLFVAFPPASAGVKPTCAQWIRGDGVRTASWRSKRIVMEREASFAWMVVEGDQSPAKPLNVDIYGYQVNAAGTEVETKLLTAKQGSGHSAVVTDTRPFRVSPGRFKDVELAIEGQCRIHSILIASTLEELQGVA